MSPRSPAHGRARALAAVFGCVAALVARADDRSGAGAATAPADATAGDATGAAPPAAEPTVGDAEEIVVVGRRARTQVPRDPTAAATVVEAERFEGEAKGVAELVATAPGVAVQQYGGLGQLATVSIRGSTASGVLVLLDGVPLNTAFGGGVDLSSIPRAWIDRIEVVRGAEGAHYGAGALGGIVNVITRRAPPGTWSAEASAASFDTFSASADGAFDGGGSALFLSGGVETTGGAFPYEYEQDPDAPSPTLVEARRAWNAAARGGGMAKLRARLGDARLDAVAQLSGGRRELPGWPYDLTPGDRQEDARATLAARVSAPGPRAGLLLSTRLSTRLDWLSARLGGATSTQRGGAAGIEGEARLLRGSSLLRLSVEAEGEALRGTGLEGTRVRANLAATASEDLGLARDRVRISPAVRVERVGPFDGISGKLGASVRLAGPLALRASAGRTFRAPSFAELHLQQGLLQPNPALVPEEGIGGDAGLVLETPRAHATLGGHATLYRDLVYYQRVSLGRLRPFNAGKVLVRGLEAELATAPARALLGLSLAASYTLLRTEILRGPAGTLGNDVPHRARHRLFARAAVAPGPLGVHVEAHVVGRQYADDHNLREIPAALLWNAGGSLRLRRAPSIQLSLEVRNVLDDRTRQDGFGNPLPGRMVLVAVRAGAGKEGPP